MDHEFKIAKRRPPEHIRYWDVDGVRGSAIALAAGDLHNCAIQSTTQVLCWGLDSVGSSEPAGIGRQRGHYERDLGGGFPQLRDPRGDQRRGLLGPRSWARM